MRNHLAKILGRDTTPRIALLLGRWLSQNCLKTTGTLWTGQNRRVSSIMSIMKSIFPPRCFLCSNTWVRRDYEIFHRKVASPMILCSRRDLRVCNSLRFPICATSEARNRIPTYNIWIKLSRRSLTARRRTSVGPGHSRSKDSQNSAPQCAVRDADVVAMLIGVSLTSTSLLLQTLSGPFRSHLRVLIQAPPFVQIHLVERAARGGSG